MRNVCPITQRELNAYFFSPIAYAVLAIFMLTLGILFMLTTFVAGGDSSLRQLVGLMPLVLAIFLPILTMRLLADEFRSGTIETLMTAPVDETEVILGKFFGALVFYCIMLLAMLAFAIVIAAFGRLDFGLLSATYIGLLLLGGLYIAVGVFFSACTSNQIIAAVCTIVPLMAFTFLADFLATKVSGFWGLILHHLSIQEHFGDFARGLVDLNDVVFFLTTAVLFLFFAVKVLESRRWR
ncbi:MAG: ABC transporter permease [Phycisphaerales bacterium]|nr:ABC transporter permease [Phycisphaerales bacterium]